MTGVANFIADHVHNHAPDEQVEGSIGSMRGLVLEGDSVL
jgi:hypothetical protein